jgi:hypothetical protein
VACGSGGTGFDRTVTRFCHWTRSGLPAAPVPDTWCGGAVQRRIERRGASGGVHLTRPIIKCALGELSVLHQTLCAAAEAARSMLALAFDAGA